MIRINLLPKSERKAASSGGGQIWGVIYIAASIIWCALLVVVYLMASSELEELHARNSDLSRKISQLKTQSSDLDDIKSKLEKSKQLESVVTELQRARMGPASVLLELSQILSLNGRPTVDAVRLQKLREENPLAGFSPNWDGRRLWLTSFTEEERECQVKGVGRTNEDIAEFLRRLSVSELFGEVTLQKSEADKSENTELRMIAFDVSCKVRY